LAQKGDERRQRIVAYIQDHLSQNGYPPSVREIGAAVGLASTASVARHLKLLEKNGQLSHAPSKRRAWRLDGASRETSLLPLVGKIQAGQPVLAQEQVEDHVTVSLGLFHPRADYLLRVDGDSMIDAGIRPGDLVAVVSQSTAEDGDIVIALIGEEATVKRLEKQKGSVRLMPANPNYSPIEAPDLAIIGRVVGLLRSY
jgi:repressor LexA